jgi:2-polyprenyl-3-methyl-5-hydroxy-6-metoxy-1,4-benzoquinol methylase
MLMTTPPFLETADIEAATPDYAQRFSGEVGRYFLDLQTALTLDLLKPYPGATVLDVGGGHGQLTRPLVEHGFRVTVTGSSETCHHYLDSLMPQGGFQYQTCDMLHLPFPDQSFDVVLSFRLLPHVSRWQELIAELSRVAGKAVIIDYPDRRSVNVLSSLLFAWKKSLEGNTRTYALFSRQQIASEFARHGLHVPVFHHEFFLPMVLHRKMGSARISRAMERFCRTCGLTNLLGSPAIVRVQR